MIQPNGLINIKNQIFFRIIKFINISLDKKSFSIKFNN